MAFPSSSDLPWDKEWIHRYFYRASI